jgi:hypothetical protein
MKKETENLINDLESKEVNINLYTLKKGRSKEPEKKYILNFAVVKGDSHKFIIDTLIKFLKNKLSIIKDAKSFFNYHSDSEFCYKLDRDKLEDLDVIFNKMNQKEQLANIKDLDFQTTGLIFEFLIDSDRYLAFQKVNIRTLIKKNFLTMILYEGIFDKVIKPDSSQLELKPFFDFLFLGNVKKFLIFNKPHFEQTFNFVDYYRKISNKAINTLTGENIQFSKELKEEISKKKSCMFKLTKLEESGILEKCDLIDFLPYQSWGVNIAKTPEGVTILNTIKEFDDFINVVCKNCVEEGVTKEKFISKNKIKVPNNKSKL